MVPVQLSAAKAAALQEVNTALDALQGAQTGGNFAEYGEALQRLDDAVKKYPPPSTPLSEPCLPADTPYRHLRTLVEHSIWSAARLR